MAALALAGCKTTLTVQRHPAFYDPSLKTVAVATFANATLRAEAGEFLAQRLADALEANGTYNVIGPKELKAKFAEAKIALAPDADIQAVVAGVRACGGAQAVITGTVKGFSADRGSHVEIGDGFGPAFGSGSWRHGHYYGSRTAVRQYSYAYSYVSAIAGMVRVADGKTLHATPRTLVARFRSSEGSERTSDEILTRAADAVAFALVREFAVTPWKIKVSRRKTLRTARADTDDALDFTNDFRTDDEKIIVVLRLPAEADRNAFSLVVTAKDSDKPLAEETFTWSADDEHRTFTFTPKKLAEAAEGHDFEVRLLLGDRQVMDRSFEIED